MHVCSGQLQGQLLNQVAQGMVGQQTTSAWRHGLPAEGVHPRVGCQPLLQGLPLEAVAPAAAQHRVPHDPAAQQATRPVRSRRSRTVSSCAGICAACRRLCSRSLCWPRSACCWCIAGVGACRPTWAQGCRGALGCCTGNLAIGANGSRPLPGRLLAGTLGSCLAWRARGRRWFLFSLQ